MDCNIIIASDSTTDLGEELVERYGIKILPLTVTLGDKHYHDGVDIDPDAVYEHYEKNGELPKTAAINIAEYNEFFSRLTADGSSVIFFTISSEMSSTFNNARLAAAEFENVYVVDTRNLSTGGGLIVVAAAEMAENGLDVQTIVANCEEMTERVSASFVIDNLEFLYKGGRCSALAAFGANLLNLKPCIYVAQGVMSVGKKYRGKYPITLKKYIEDQLAELDSIEPHHIFVTHAGCDESIWSACVQQVKDLNYFSEVHITRAGCTVSSHCGRNTLGVLFVKKKKS